MIIPVYGDVTTDLLIARDSICFVCFTPHELSCEDAGKHRAETLIASCKEAGKLGRGSVILSYSYDDDPRELYEIPEVVGHIKKIFDDFPALTYFIAPDIEFVRPLLLALYGAKIIGKSGGVAHIGIPDINEARNTSKMLRDTVTEYALSAGDKTGVAEIVGIINSVGV